MPQSTITCCYHCGLTAEGQSVLRHDGKTFCCQGCLGAFRLIHQAGLAAYYDQRSEHFTGFQAIPDIKATFWEDDSFQKEMVQDIAGGLKEVHLLLEGIHCAACVWLNEQILRRIPGVVSAQVNFANYRATVRWDPGQTTLSHVIASLTRIGYKAHPYDATRVEQVHRARNRALMLRLIVAGFGAANIMMIAVALYSGTLQGMEESYRIFFHWVSLILATPVVFYSGSSFFQGAWQGIRTGHLTMDFSIAVGAGITYAASLWALLGGSGKIYFDSVTLFVFALLLGRYLESAARRKAAGTLERVAEFQPRSIQVVREGVEQALPLAALKVGDAIIVRPGEQIAVDGIVIEGHTSVDESLLTGESVPVEKKIGSSVIGGSINGEGAIHVRVQNIGGNTTLAKIVATVLAAQASRNLSYGLAERLAPWFTGAIVILALVTFVIWWGVDPSQALENAVSVLIITCPCALGLATPAALLVACGTAAQKGVLLRDPATLERLAMIDHIVLDKTGVVTEGRPRVTRYAPVAGIDQRQLLSQSAAVERYSEHPLGRAILRSCEEQGWGPLPAATDATIQPGMGLSARVDGCTTRVGRREFVLEEGTYPDFLPPPLDGARPVTWIACSVDYRPWGWLGLEDTIKEDAKATIATLQKGGLSMTLLSGDRAEVVAWTAARVAIREHHGGVLPEDKLQFIRTLQAGGTRVAMVGDGLNDAPALALADVGMAAREATDLSVETSDVILLNRGLGSVAFIVNLAKSTVRVIRENLWFSLGYNLITIPLAMAGWVTPLLAAIAMPLSSLAVVANALRLARRTDGIHQ
ncbi:MAG: heavy metal translocating P-type ATPase [Magnetococcales bacterium]|nr:heavy metal translocating P-type ATPase [Magnetococcales bacterium]